MRKLIAMIAAAVAASATLPAATINLANITGDTTLNNGDVATGTLAGDYKISVAAGATVTLRNAVIEKNTGWACVNCIGNATIVLEGENTLHPLAAPYPAIHVPANKTLTIQGSGSLAARGGSGSAAIGSGNQIDCGNIVIAGGTITARRGSGQTSAIGSGFGSVCGNITISGGSVTTIVGGDWGNGIGAGQNGVCGDILISGGTVYADGDNYGAGIGSSMLNSPDPNVAVESRCGNITISGGNVTAISGIGAAAIGSASGGSSGGRSVCGDITISGGIVNAIVRPTAVASYASVGIGAGIQHASCGNITIGPGVTRVTATCCTESRCIPIGATKESTDHCNVTCGTVTIDPHLFDETHETAATANPDVVTLTRTIESRIVNLAAITGSVTVTNGYTVTGELAGNYKVTIADGATVTLWDVTIEGKDSNLCQWAGITCEGDATIIVEGNNNITGFYSGYPGIYVPAGKTLTIKGAGFLRAASNAGAAGIGGGNKATSCGNIVIESGTIEAVGKGSSGPGIGGSTCGDITIRGGTVTATGGTNAAGIGSDNMGTCGKITIAGGTVNATGGKSAAGIGGGCEGYCGQITIGAGIARVVATCGESHDVPIGEGMYGSCSGVSVAGGLADDRGSPTRTISRDWDGNLATLTANVTIDENITIFGTLGGNYEVSIADGTTVTISNAVINGVNSFSCKWAGITCEGDATIILKGENIVRGYNEDYPGICVPVGKTLTIRGDGSLAASSNGYGAGIGGGFEIDCGNIVVEGGTIAATGGGYAAGIGGGYDASCGDITVNGGTVVSTGGDSAAGIGSGWDGSCGDISFGTEIVRVTATAGGGCDNPIGAGEDGTSGDVIIAAVLKDNTSGSTRTIEPKPIIDLSAVTVNTTIPDGYVVIGSHSGTNKITIADGATVVLRDVSINADGRNRSSTPWAGITCLGDATIILVGASTVKGCYEYWPGIYVPENKTLTITGDGSLTAAGGRFYGAGIGGGYGSGGACGNIGITGGAITAAGGGFAAGIGSGYQSSCENVFVAGGSVTASGGSGAAGIGGGYDGNCGNIGITGGSVDATGGSNAAGIGSGCCYEYGGYCHFIYIGSDITRVVATCGEGCENPIGTGVDGECDILSISTLLRDDRGHPTRTITTSGYTVWAVENGITGAWNMWDANGIYNVFRYAFDKPTGVFTIIGIEFNEAGKAVVVTPPLVNGEGFALSILATDRCDGKGAAATSYPLDPSGKTTIDETVSGSRFFRLKAQEE